MSGTPDKDKGKKKGEERRKKVEQAQRRAGTSFAEATEASKKATNSDTLARSLELAEEITRMLPSIGSIVNG